MFPQIVNISTVVWEFIIGLLYLCMCLKLSLKECNLLERSFLISKLSFHDSRLIFRLLALVLWEYRRFSLPNWVEDKLLCCFVRSVNMGGIYSDLLQKDVTPKWREQSSFDPNYGFPNGRKERSRHTLFKKLFPTVTMRVTSPYSVTVL